MICAFLSINTELLPFLFYVEKIVDWIIKETSRPSSWKRTRSCSFSTSHGNLNSVASRIFSKATHLTPSMSTRADKNQPVSESEYSNTSLIFWHRLIFFYNTRLLQDSREVIWHWGEHFFSLIWFRLKCFHKWYLEKNVYVTAPYTLYSPTGR